MPLRLALYTPRTLSHMATQTHDMLVELEDTLRKVILTQADKDKFLAYIDNLGP